MTDDSFYYGQLGRDWWLQTAQTIGANERHAKFAAAKHRGETDTSAATGAGFGGVSDASVRSEGYRLARSNKVNQLLALAVAESGSGYDGTVTRQEARQILTMLARGSDPAQRIKAIEMVLKMDQQEADQRQRVKDEERLDPHAMDRDLICGIPMSGVGAMIVCALRFNKTGAAAGMRDLQTSNFSKKSRRFSLKKRRKIGRAGGWRKLDCELLEENGLSDFEPEVRPLPAIGPVCELLEETGLRIAGGN